MGIYYVLSRLALIGICLNGFLVYIRSAFWLEPNLAMDLFEIIIFMGNIIGGLGIILYSSQFNRKFRRGSYGYYFIIAFLLCCVFSLFSVSAAIVQAFTYCLIVFEIDAERSLLLERI